MTLTDINNAITTGLTALPGIAGVRFYDAEMTEDELRALAQDAPAILVEEGRSNPAEDYGAGVYGAQLEYAALVLVWANRADARTVCRELGMRVAQKIDSTRWGLDDLGLGEVTSEEWDDFRPELESFVVRRIEFTHHAMLEAV